MSTPAAAASSEWACKVMSPPLVHTDRTRSRSMWVRAIVCEDPVVLWLPDRRYMPLSMPRAVAINTGIDTMSLVPWAGPISVQRPSLSHVIHSHFLPPHLLTPLTLLPTSPRQSDACDVQELRQLGRGPAPCSLPLFLRLSSSPPLQAPLSAPHVGPRPGLLEQVEHLGHEVGVLPLEGDRLAHRLVEHLAPHHTHTTSRRHPDSQSRDSHVHARLPS
jgi:hypothetical protein